jgi:hypothetical protein
VKVKYSLTRADEKTKRKPGKWRDQIARLLLEIEELNARTIDLGMPEENIVDVAALRAKFQPGEEEEQNGGREKRDDANGDDIGDETGNIERSVD